MPSLKRTLLMMFSKSEVVVPRWAHPHQ
jgi:hypothetical protein